MTETEIRRVLRTKYPSESPKECRRRRLKLRFAGRLKAEIARTQEKLAMLIELKTAEEQQIINGWRKP